MTKSINKICFWLLVLMIIYQDSPLGIYLGAFGYSFVPLISILIFIVIVINNQYKIKISRSIKKFCELYIYLLIISVVSLVIWFIQGGSSKLLGEDVIIKTIKVLLYFFSYIAFLYDIKYLTKKFTESDFLKPVFYTLLLLTGICIIEYFLMPYAFSFLHFTGGKYYTRIRLLTKESSWTSMMIFIYGILSLYYSLKVKSNRKLFIITCVCLAILIGLSSSKTLMVIIFASLFVAIIINAKNMTRKRLIASFGLILVFFAAYLLMANKLISAVERSLQWSSIYTRTYTLIIGFLIGLIYPLGTGTALYLHIFPSYLSKYYYLIKKYDSGHALREINSYIGATSDKSVAVKSGLMQYNMYWGIFGTIWILRILIKDYYLPFTKLKGKYNILIQVAMVISIFMLLFSSDFSFEFWLLIAFVDFLLSHSKCSL